MNIKDMRAIGIIRRTDDLGRIVIPMEVRRILGIEPRTPMEMFAYEDGIFLRMYKPNSK